MLRVCGFEGDGVWPLTLFRPLPSPLPPPPGTVPAELGRLGALRTLRLEDNQLTGELCHAPYREGLGVENAVYLSGHLLYPLVHVKRGRWPNHSLPFACKTRPELDERYLLRVTRIFCSLTLKIIKIIEIINITLVQ